MKQIRIVLFLSLLIVPPVLLAGTDRVAVVTVPPAEPRNGWYAGNRDPLQPSPFLRLPVGSIVPKGWLRQQLELDANGLSGRLPEVSSFVKFEGNAWANSKGNNGWEEMPYWLKGFGDLGYVLRDERITADAKKWIEAIFTTQDSSGWFGPEKLKTSIEGKPDLWPHMLVLDSVRSYHEFTGDKRVIDFMTRYFKWQNAQAAELFRAGYWPHVRYGDNIDSIYWLYNRTGEAWLLDLARKIHENMAKWRDGVINLHNVNMAQGFREPTQFWAQDPSASLREGAERNYIWIMDRVGQFPGGGFAGDENVRLNEGDPRQGFETCGFVEFMRSFEMLVRITGEAKWADRCEEVAFNGLPAALDPGHKGLHYMTSANLIRCDLRERPGFYTDAWCRSGFSAVRDRCCLHNYEMGWPYYAEELWLATPDWGLCASLYAASEVKARVGERGTEVTMVEETLYPFEETIRFRVKAPAPVRFPLYLRLPRWCSKVTLKINNRRVSDVRPEPQKFVLIDREWKDGDTLELGLPMKLAVRKWEKNQNCVSVDRGPLTYSLKIGEDWHEVPGGKPGWPNREVTPTTPWNYGLELDPARPDSSIKVCQRHTEPGANPFTFDGTPIELTAKARRIPGWVADRTGAMPKMRPCPAKSTEPVEKVTLVPMGAARLRVSSFPTVSSAADANEWPAPAVPDFDITCSHVSGGDSTEALADGKEPRSSGDHSILRFTWWDHKGSREWVQYTWPKARKFSKTSVFWFDDTGHGQCRVPKSWRLLYRDGEQWKPVKTSGEFGTGKDAFQTVSFEPVETTAVRIEVQLQPEFSGGILEWKVK